MRIIAADLIKFEANILLIIKFMPGIMPNFSQKIRLSMLINVSL